jgi:hypothetical protein
MSSYQSVPMGSSSLEEPTTVAPLPRSLSRLHWIAAGLAICGFVAFLVHGSDSSSKSAATATAGESLGMLGSSAAKVASCTLEECYSSNCDQTLAPFTCLMNNGGPHGGCSATPWITGTCEKQCDLTGCSKLSIPNDVRDCNVPCGKEWCDSAGERLCPSDVSYQCLAGAAAFGCSFDKYQWSLRSSSATCSSCCNTDTCSHK